jgi:TRAP-type C4-dicarboxylate transport system permease large subunit
MVMSGPAAGIAASRFILHALGTLMPLMEHLHVDPVYFGVVLVLTLMIGTVTPPVGVVPS